MWRWAVVAMVAVASTAHAKQEEFMKAVFGMKAGEQNRADAEMIMQQLQAAKAAQNPPAARVDSPDEVSAAAASLRSFNLLNLPYKRPMLVLLASAAVRQLRHELAARAVRRERARADAELGRRREVLLDEVLLAYSRLESTPPRALANATEAELIGVKESLVERAQVASEVLKGYTALGMETPPHFTQWELEDLQARAANVTQKAPLLREVLRLQKQLGQTRADWELPAYDEAALEAMVAKLEPELATRNEWKRKQVLLGKVEAAHWRRGEEVPIALGSLSCEELEEYYERLS